MAARIELERVPFRPRCWGPEPGTGFRLGVMASRPDGPDSRRRVEGGQNDWSVCTTWLRHGNKYYLLDVLRGRFDYPTLKAQAILHARLHMPGKILIEDTGVGTALLTELKDAGFPAIGVIPEHDKRTRMSIQSGKFESGQVFFPNEASWLPDLEAELLPFPNGHHDDQVDSISQALADKVSEYGWTQKSIDGLAQFTEAMHFATAFGQT